MKIETQEDVRDMLKLYSPLATKERILVASYSSSQPKPQSAVK